VPQGRRSPSQQYYSILLHEELHWLDVIDRVCYKLAVLAYRSLHGTAPQYLTSLLTSASEVTGRSAAKQKLIVRSTVHAVRKTFGCRAFSVASPSVWNALPDSLRDPELTLDVSGVIRRLTSSRYIRCIALEIFW